MDELNLLTPKQVTKKLSIPISTLYRWISEGNFPKPIKVGKRKTLFRESKIAEWLDEKEQAESEIQGA